MRMAANDQSTYEIFSKQHVDDEMEPASTCDSYNGVPATDSHSFPSGRTKSSTELSWLVTRPLPSPLVASSRQAVMLIPPCHHFTEPMRAALKHAVAHPPVTTATLLELDLNWILHNMNLRSDINFEADLHFMPIKGKRAEQKRKEATQYWLALATELQIHVHNRVGCVFPERFEVDHNSGSFEPRLPEMFADLRELLETLVPDKDHDAVAENLDVAFLMQQIENGVLDICRLAEWLASLLRSHCAPIRDEWTEQMTQQIEKGSRESDMGLLVNGIEKLFSVLEAMKLDVANHQIRTFRFHLLEDTVPFQQKFFAQKIVDGRIDSRSCREWYDEVRVRQTSLISRPSSAESVDGCAILISGIITTLFTLSSASVLPKSFHLDLKRLERIRSDMEDLIYLRICVRVFDELHSSLTSGRADPVPLERYAELQSRVLAIVDEQADNNNPWQSSSGDVALEITRAVCIFCGWPESAIPDFVIQSAHLRFSVLSFSDTPICNLIWETSQDDLAEKTIHYAQTFNDMTALAMSEAQQQWRQQQEDKSKLRPVPDMEDIARRLAHLSVLHWKIWANIVYLGQIEQSASGPTDVTYIL